jgi:hypothetical protein
VIVRQVAGFIRIDEDKIGRFGRQGFENINGFPPAADRSCRPAGSRSKKPWAMSALAGWCSIVSTVPSGGRDSAISQGRVTGECADIDHMSWSPDKDDQSTAENALRPGRSACWETRFSSRE